MVKIVAIRRTFMKYVIIAPKVKKLILAFQEIFILFKNRRVTAVKISKLSIPAQGHAIANFAVPNAPVTCKVGIPVPISMPGIEVYPIKPKTPEARLAVVGTSN